MKKALMIIGIITVSIVGLVILIIAVTSLTSRKLECKSKEGNITLMYDSKTIKGYTAVGISYDFDGQKEVANRLGIEQYIDDFTSWFENNTTGTCTKK